MSDYAVKSIMGEEEKSIDEHFVEVERKLTAIFNVLDTLAANIDNKEKQSTAKSIIAQILSGEADGLKNTAKKEDAGEKKEEATIGDLL
jgi:hypothetical protein